MNFSQNQDFDPLEHPNKASLPTDPRSYESPDGDILPYADIEEPGVIEIEKKPRSNELIFAEGIIAEGIAKSEESGYGEIKVEFWVPEEKNPNGGYQNRMSLAQFFGGNSLRNMVTKEEYDELFTKYGEVSNEHALHRAHKFGNIAASGQKTYFESGQKRYRDRQSAAAGDWEEDD